MFFFLYCWHFYGNSLTNSLIPYLKSLTFLSTFIYLSFWISHESSQQHTPFLFSLSFTFLINSNFGHSLLSLFWFKKLISCLVGNFQTYHSEILLRICSGVEILPTHHDVAVRGYADVWRPFKVGRIFHSYLSMIPLGR